MADARLLTILELIEEKTYDLAAPESDDDEQAIRDDIRELAAEAKGLI